MMPKFKKTKNEKNITYKLAGDQDNFTNEDKKKLFKLLKKIENGENISEKFNKSNYNTQKLLTKKIIYKDEEKEGTLTLLCQSMFYKNNQAFEELLQEAINQGILQDVLSEKLTQKLPNGLTITYTALVSCMENSKAIRTVLEASKKNGILEEILNQKVKVEKAENQEISYTLLDYANKHNCKESAKILKEFEEILNIEVKNDMPVSDNAETRCEDVNKDYEIHESRIVSSEEARNILIESENPLMCESNKEAENSFDEQELNASDNLFPKLCCDIDAAGKEKEPLTIAKQQKEAITIDLESKEKLMRDLVYEEECKDNLNTSTIEHKSAVDFVPLIGDYEDDNQLIYEKSTTASTETVAQGLNASDSLSSSKPYFYSEFGKGNTADEKEKLLIQQRQAIVVGSAGVVLLVSSIALYIMKMPVVVAVVGIAGLACIGFALYNAIKPGTKLEKVEDIEQPIVKFSLNQI
ncbi:MULTISPECIES: WD_0033/WD_0034 family tandem repeat-containing protein [unclassified Wolbachia]|uniref:WD_0033/WD_0034 family tandem repeat-containing protein n=2 Tax=Wolbachia TaxID=953 RepID=UPI00221EFA62|nr:MULTISPECIES: hypothetical protein [unclassified Wolbachia]